MQSTINSSQTLTSETAKNLVFDHWKFLASLASKRFPNDGDMGDQALSYVLDKLEEHDWKRVKCWDGNFSFTNFIEACATSLIAEKLVFDHWDFLTSLAVKRFPNDCDMGDQALSYVLDKLEENDWKRIKCWDGNSSFATFIAVFATRLMTDFVRSKFGYHRPPAWLLKKQEVEWIKAFKLCTVEKYERREALEILYSEASAMNRNEIENIVNTVYSECNKQARFSEGNIALDQIVEPSSRDNAESEESDIYKKQLIEVLIGFIESDEDSFNSITDGTLKDLLSYLKTHINMSDDDRLLLKLRYCNGKKINEISQITSIEGNLYRRINGLIDDLKNTCQQFGLLF